MQTNNYGIIMKCFIYSKGPPEKGVSDPGLSLVYG